MLAAILDFSVRHHLCQFMPAVSETTENVEHFDIWHILLYGGVRVHNFSVMKVTLPLRLPRLGKRELILVLFARLFGLCLFGFVDFLFLLVSGKGCGFWLWHSLDFSLSFFMLISPYRNVSAVANHSSFSKYVFTIIIIILFCLRRMAVSTTGSLSDCISC